MTTPQPRPVRRVMAGVLAGTLALSGAAAVAVASPANAVPGIAFERLAGPNRYGTAAKIAKDTFPLGASVAIVARGDVFADALAANYLAGAVGAPVLLTASRSLPAVTSEVLAELGVERVVIVGGTTAVSTDVEKALDVDYDVDRLGGTDRYLTAELVAMATAGVPGGSVGTFRGLRTAILGSGQAFPDVLAAAPLSYSAEHPLVISRPTDLPDPTEDVLIGLDVEQVVIVGGTDAVSQAVEDEVELITGNPVVRLFGRNRYETAAAIAQAAYDDFGFDDTHVNLARGDDFADALAGGPHGGEELSPIVLTAPTALSTATRTFLENNSGTLVDGHIFGGFDAIEADVEQAAEDAAEGEAPVPADTTAPTATVEAGIAGTSSIVVTFSEDVVDTTVTASDFTLNGAPLPSTATVTTAAGPNGTDVTTVTLATPLAEGDAVVLLAGSVSDQAGNTGPFAAVTDVTAPAPDTTAPTATVDAGTAGGSTITVTFSEDVVDTSVTASDFTLNGNPLPSTATVTTAAGPDGTDVTTVTLATPLAEGDVVVLLADSVSDLAGNVGPDGAAVSDSTGPAPADTTPPVFTTAVAALNGDGPDTLVLTYSETISALGGTFDNGQIFYDADCNGGVDRVGGSVTQNSPTSLTLTIINGALPSVDDPNDCVGYVDFNNPDTAETGDVVDGSGNAQPSPDQVAVPAATV